ncbi:MAG: DUF58 domain-containing protein [Limisphaerales bacterium]
MTPILRLLYWLYRLGTAIFFWMGQRFTPAGLALLAAIGVMGPLAFDTDNNVAYQVLCLLLALLGTAVAFGWWFRWRFVVDRVLPRFGSVGVPLEYRVTIFNPGKRPQTGLTYLETLPELRPPLAEWVAFQRAEERRLRRLPIWKRRPRRPFRVAKVPPVEVPPIPPGQSVDLAVRLTPLRRGVLRFHTVTLGRTDPLGLFRALARRPLPQTLLVLPRRYFIPAVALPGALKYQQGGVALASSVGQSDEFVSLRDYRRGDPYKHIHWRSWAKTGTPIVKEFEDEFFVRHALVLDTFSADPHSEVFEAAVSVAASFACTVQTQESLLDLLFAGTEAYCFTAGRGLAHTDHLLEILASVSANLDPRQFGKLEELVVDHAPSVSGCILVLLAWDAPRQELVRKLRLLGVPLLVLVLRASAGQPLDPGPLREDPAAFRVLDVPNLAEQLAQL